MTPFLIAADVAAELHITLPRLRAMAERGQYPELLHVSRGHYLVRRSDHEAWMAARFTKAEQEAGQFEADRVAAIVRGA